MTGPAARMKLPLYETAEARESCKRWIPMNWACRAGNGAVRVLALPLKFKHRPVTARCQILFTKSYLLNAKAFSCTFGARPRPGSTKTDDT
jgi:hypothetical protein